MQWNDIMSLIALSDSGVILSELDGDQSFEELEMKADNIVEQHKNLTDYEIKLLANQIRLSNQYGESDVERWLENSKVSLSNWQKIQLESLKDGESEIRCLLNSWLVTEKDLLKGKLILKISNTTFIQTICLHSSKKLSSNVFDSRESTYVRYKVHQKWYALHDVFLLHYLKFNFCEFQWNLVFLLS